MGTYRISRSIEASLVDWLTEKLEDGGWTGIRVEKSFSQVSSGTLPCICINALEIRPEKLEIGSKTNLKYFTINIRIFATSDGNRLDLSDFVTDLLESDINYYTYTITNGIVTAKVLSGRIVVTRWFDDTKELTNTENLEKEDRYRHLLSFECYVAN
jgi:hypothetical protein